MTKTILLAGILTCCAAAQPPNVLRVVRNGTIEPYVAAHAPVNVLGFMAISGFSETWLLELYDTFGGLEDVDKALSAGTPVHPAGPPFSTDEVLTASKTLIAVYRPGFSYRPDQAAQTLAKMRYCDVAIYRIRPGTEADFAKFMRVRRFSQDSINLDVADIVYQVVSGAPSGTYIALTPLPSLRMLDDGRAAAPVYAEGDQAAARKIAADSELIHEHLWFRVEPRNSWVSDEFASPDAGFWHPGAK